MKSNSNNITIKKSQGGFGTIQTVIIIAVISIIGAAALYVVRENKNTKTEAVSNSSSQNKNSAESQGNKAVSEEWLTWKTYNDPNEEFEFKYPPSWVFSNYTESCSANILLFGVDMNSVGRCGTGIVGQMNLIHIEGDVRTKNGLSKLDYPDLKSTVVTMNGQMAEKQTGTFTLRGEQGPGPQNGDKIIEYLLFTNGKTYIFTYTSKVDGSYPDAQEDFETMVTKTFKLK